MKAPLVSRTGQQSTVTISAEIFDGPVNAVLLAQAIRVYQSNLRQGTSKTKSRGEINRTKAKWFKQKGTGNARHGAKTPNIFVGGGVAHGPRGNQNWTLGLSQTQRKQATIAALRAQKENIVINAEVLELSGKTADGAQLIESLTSIKNRVLVIVSQATPEVLRSLRNIERVLVSKASRVNALEIATANAIVIDQSALPVLEQRLVTKKSAVQTAKIQRNSSPKPVKSAVKKTAPKPAAKAVKKTTTGKKTTKKTTKSA